jgi:UDP-N-acetylmuramoyl-tripeptide--D-alanyl-D-alanine ligase
VTILPVPVTISAKNQEEEDNLFLKRYQKTPFITKGVFYFYGKLHSLNISALYDIYLRYPSVQTDSRKVRPGDIFFALKGPNFNGNKFAEAAINDGAAYAIIDESEFAVNERCILVSDVLETLQNLARHHRQQINIPFIAVTGSNGKTTTKELITTVLSKKYITYATIGNLNNHIGVPLTLLSIKKDAEMAVIEMGANHQKEIESYCKIALPTHALITNCGKAHIEGFGGIEGVRKGKGELYDFIRENGGTIFRNADLDYLSQMAAGIETQVTYGSADADYIGKPLMDDVFLQVAILNRDSEALVKTRLVGDYNYPNVMAAVAIGLHFNIDIDTVRNAVESYSPDNSRSQWITAGSNNIVLDAYNANPSSMKAAIINFAGTELKNKILWLGGMKEMGDQEREEHAELVRMLNEYNWDDVVLVGTEFKGLSGNYKYFDNSAEAAQFLKTHRPENASILIKGSRGSKMELLLDAIRD